MPHLSDTPAAPPSRQLVLVGAGHAHLHVVSHRHRLDDTRVTLVDPGGFWYSGMANGMLGGRLTPAEDRLDPARLAARHGVTAVRGRLAGLDLIQRQAILEDGRALPFDLLSLNLGSSCQAPPARRPGPAVWTVKPIPCLVALRRCLEADFRRGAGPRLVVVGGGASGVEVACNLSALSRRHGVNSTITLVTRGQRLLEDAPRGASRWLSRLLARRGIQVLGGTSVIGHAAGGALIRSDETLRGEDSLALLEADHVIHASGLTPPRVIDRLGLPVIPDRGLAVASSLQSTGDPDVFAAGDCAAMVDHRLPRLGVYSERQAPVLLDNLAARLADRPLRDHVPQPRALAILDLGEGLGLAIRGQSWWTGRLMLLWKRWLDRRFMARYR
ncbi:NAD(P)/FAD-dependent oxidoreductase [Halomonas kalidii]|uniref:FAD-dependent oxidoreductase n=1 Tax=Halomonas kalidii TaxID=3043293 RepID=A0ABT6VFW1_9GAMM|nr:FAD-dependent oxidoreductase [Halomonas kalidii]MDI5932880.1 FAD-dependent oxidoreductase [Halomonas kalidii]